VGWELCGAPARKPRPKPLRNGRESLREGAAASMGSAPATSPGAAVTGRRGAGLPHSSDIPAFRRPAM
jgi:hypothetical protein